MLFGKMSDTCMTWQVGVLILHIGTSCLGIDEGVNARRANLDFWPHKVISIV